MRDLSDSPFRSRASSTEKIVVRTPKKIKIEDFDTSSLRDVRSRLLPGHRHILAPIEIRKRKQAPTYKWFFHNIEHKVSSI